VQCIVRWTAAYHVGTGPTSSLFLQFFALTRAFKRMLVTAVRQSRKLSSDQIGSALIHRRSWHLDVRNYFQVVQGHRRWYPRKGRQQVPNGGGSGRSEVSRSAVPPADEDIDGLVVNRNRRPLVVWRRPVKQLKKLALMLLRS